MAMSDAMNRGSHDMWIAARWGGGWFNESAGPLNWFGNSISRA